MVAPILPIETSRLLLRLPELTDAQSFLEIVQGMPEEGVVFVELQAQHGQPDVLKKVTPTAFGGMSSTTVSISSRTFVIRIA